MDVVYNASNNELVRTKTLVKNCIVQIDSQPFRTWFENKYHAKLSGKKDEGAADAAAEGEKKQSDHLQRKVAGLKAHAGTIDPKIAEVSVTAAVVLSLSHVWP